MKRYFGIIALTLAVALTLSACGTKRNTGGSTVAVTFPKEPVTLEYWRLYDSSSVFDEFIAAYKELHPNVSIIVKNIALGPNETIYDYQNKVTKAIADGQGPDMFMIHNDWLPYAINQISPAPRNVVDLQDYQRVFPNVVQNDFVSNNQIYAIPYYIDDLMLFYNPQLLSNAGIKRLPQTWQDIVNITPSLTKFNSKHQLIQSAIPLGVTDTHMSRFADILATLMMQNGASMTSADNQKATFDLPLSGTPARFPGKEALDFYTSFANPAKQTYTYTDTIKGSPPPANWQNLQSSFDFPADIQAFMEGKAAMFIGYAYQIQNIKNFNPNLQFGTTKLPQVTLDNPKVIANYWGETVSKNSKYPSVAWDFIRFMATSGNNSRYINATHRVSARKDLQASMADNNLYGPVAQQASYAQSWYRQNTTKVEAIFADMVKKVLHNGVDTQTAVRAAAEAINNLQ